MGNKTNYYYMVDEASVPLWYAWTPGTRTHDKFKRHGRDLLSFPGLVRTQVGRKRSTLSRFLAKGMGEETVGKPSTQQCDIGNDVKEPRQTGSPAVI